MSEALKPEHQNHVPTAKQGEATAGIADWIADRSRHGITPVARRRARHALLDWFGVTIGGADDPLVDILIDELEIGDSQSGPCTIVGRGQKTGRLDAALINGAASHALDYDDVNKRIHGHPTVVVTPAVMAVAESQGSNGKDIVDAMVVGTEATCLVGQMAGYDHYALGYHATGTLGTFGAAAGAAHLLNLDTKATRYTLGIAASQASGLKANFGTMTKPFHAGKAAMHGVLAARLAARGFTANENVLEARAGSADAMLPGFTPGFTGPNPPGYFAIEQNLFKYHAACYLTHASIEAICKIRDENNIDLSDLKKMTLKIHEGHLSVCNIPDPTTGLEIKFSIRQCAVLALAGVDTGSMETYNESNALNEEFAAARALTELEIIDIEDNMAAEVEIELKDGRKFSGYHNAGIPAADVDAQEKKLVQKFHVLCEPKLGSEATAKLADAILNLDENSDAKTLMALATW